MSSALKEELRSPGKFSVSTVEDILSYFGNEKSRMIASYPMSALRHPSSKVRIAALNAIESIGEHDAAIPEVIKALHDSDAGVREAAVRTLERGEFDPQKVAKYLKSQNLGNLTVDQKQRLKRFASQ